MQSPAQSGGEPGGEVLPRDLALLDSGHTPLGHTHLVRYLLLGHAPGTAYLGRLVTDHLSQQLVLASTAASPPALDVRCPDLAPRYEVYWRRRIAGSERPDRVFDAVAAVIAETGILRGRRKRCVDSTVFDDAVATQDTVTQLVAAIGKVARVVPGALEVIGRVCTLDYSRPGKPSIGWDDPQAKQSLISDLVNDALAALAELTGENAPQREDTAADALGLLALVAGQDVEPAQGSDGTDGRWRIARKVAPDRVISTVDPQTRHTRKSKSVRKDGYRGHVAAEPETGLITDCEMTQAAEEENSDPMVGEQMISRDRYHQVEGVAHAEGDAQARPAPTADEQAAENDHATAEPLTAGHDAPEAPARPAPAGDLHDATAVSTEPTSDQHGSTSAADTDAGHPAGGQVQTTEQLSARVRAIGDLRQRCAYREMGAALPSLIADLHTSIEGGRDDARLLHLAVLLHVLGTQTYLHIVRAPDDLRLVAASLANNAAERLDDPVSLGVAAFGFSNVLLASGSFVLADTVVRRAGVTPGADAELAGMLALSTSLTAAADGRPSEVAAALDYAAELAEHTGEGNRFFLSFGPTNVTLWRIGAALEAGEYARTVDLAQTVTPERIRASSRRAGYWMSYGRALARIRRREQEAVLALRRAETISPEEVQRNPFVREVLAALRARVRRDSPAGRELQRMAYRCGLPV